MRRAECDRGREIRAHSHRQKFQPVALRDFRGERKMRRRRLLEGRNAHQAGDRQTDKSSRHALMKASACSGSTPAFCGSAPVFTCTNRSGCLSGFLDFLRQRLADARPIDRMDRVEQRQRFLRLVGLQRPDQMQREIGMALADRRPFAFGFLHAVFAEGFLAQLRSPARSRLRRRSCSPRSASPTTARGRPRGRPSRSRL